MELKKTWLMKKKTERKMGKRHIWDKQKTNSKMIDSNLIILIITLKGNGLNIQIFKYKDCQLRLKKAKPNYICLYKT